MYDIIIIGSGPAGLTAGIYACRSRLRVLMLASQVNPSLITTTDVIENYPGYPGGIGGFELIEKIREQALLFGLEIVDNDVTSLERITADGMDAWRVHVDGGSHEALSVIVATGTQYAHLNVPGEQEYTGRGVSYCATCDGPFYRDASVAVVGGGDAAVQEALFLTKFARKVTIVHRRDRLRAAGDLQEKAFGNERIDFAWNSVVDEIKGDSAVEKILLHDVNDLNLKQALEVQGVFIFTGSIPNTSFVRDILSCDEKGYILADDEMKTSAKGTLRMRGLHQEAAPPGRDRLRRRGYGGLRIGTIYPGAQGQRLRLLEGTLISS
jgi:thioredoxin reductase (NADPH)